MQGAVSPLDSNSTLFTEKSLKRLSAIAFGRAQRGTGTTNNRPPSLSCRLLHKSLLVKQIEKLRAWRGASGFAFWEMAGCGPHCSQGYFHPDAIIHKALLIMRTNTIA